MEVLATEVLTEEMLVEASTIAPTDARAEIPGENLSNLPSGESTRTSIAQAKDDIKMLTQKSVLLN